MLKELSEKVLFLPLIILFFTSVFLTFKTKFIQVRMFPRMMYLFFKSIFSSKQKAGEHSIQSHKALFTAMSTTLGIGNIIGPVIAIKLGGPGAFLWFLVVIIFGAATTFTEVTYAVAYRHKRKDGTIAGGPMEYLSQEISPKLATWYSYFGAVLLVAWCSNQSNTLSDILQTYSISKYVTGGVLAALVIFCLLGGIKRIANLSSKMVPLMFVLYCGASFWVILCNISKLPAVIQFIFSSALNMQAVSGAVVGVTVQKTLRWAIAKGIQVTESGIGTATIPHSKSATKNPTEQGVLAMVSIYSVLFVCTLSGLVTLLTGTWQDPSLGIGINVLAKAFSMYFPQTAVILALTAFLFAFGTILGNAYNGGQCFLFVTNNKYINGYNIAVAIVVFFGAVMDAELVWSITDFFIIPVAFINLIGVLYLAFKRPELLKI